ncbi:hypothetical protein FH972_009491 [Carpinus fangiana]|uniref:Uncharacterized protein n=1 Tax=Carpinus fangiana TaxID=176857 RepID=A0A660KN60_9ROSI|nr:hypothetical protein FH972_009491 [Carpinus fangiana]
MEPWLDSLSEDWNSEPRSSSPKSAPRGSPAPTQHPAPTPVPRHSRIPRFNHNSPHIASPAFRPAPSPQNEKRALTERKSSDINIRPKSSSAVPQKDNLLPRPIRSSSTSSVGSVVRHNSAVRQPNPCLSPNENATPEWKKLAFRNQSGPASQQDLFAPIGLENIFAGPSSDEQDQAQANETFAFSEDLQSMPSSPPTWALSQKHPIGSQKSQDGHLAKSKLSIVQENNELEDGSDDVVFQDPDVQTKLPFPNEPESPAATSVRSERNVFVARPPSSQPASSRQGSSVVTGGFSPVYISKHNADNGQISYTAVDPSDPGVQERIRLLQSHSSRNDSRHQSLQQLHTPEHGADQDDMAELPSLTGFVSVERGGHSNDGSFRRRPLSPSTSSSNLPSESVVPSDSVSQIYFANHDRRGSSERQGYDDASHTPTPVTPIAPPRSPERTKSSGSPLKLFGDHDTFTNKQLLRRMSQMNDVTSVSSPISDKQNKEEQNSASEDGSNDDDSVGTTVQYAVSQPTQQDASNEAFINKREAPIPFKESTPKRQRTLSHTEASANLGIAAEQNRRMQSVIGKKRKDALYKSDQIPAEPDEIARRQMLRPRNPTPSQASQDRSRLLSSDAGDDSFLSGFYNKNVEASSDSSEGYVTGPSAAKIRALASEAASFRVQGPASLQEGTPRKPSVSTQDYLNEAMKIMDLIRSRKRSVTALTGVEEISVVEHVEQDLAGKRLFTPQTISRPPSREGAATAWRSRTDQVPDAKVMDHLRKYEETGDESFIVSSILRSMKANREANEDEDFQSHGYQDSNIQIREGISQDDLISDFEGQNQVEIPGSPMKTTGSSQSTDSSGQTINTTSSQRARNIGTIQPDKVSHLIHAETGGMRFDTERQTWVRIKQQRKAIQETILVTSSSTGSDDPLGNIPDLSVNEDVESHRINSTGSGSATITLPSQLPSSAEISGEHDLVPVEDNPSETQRDEMVAQQAVADPPYEMDADSEPALANPRGVEAGAPRVKMDESEASTRPISKTPTGTVKSMRRGQSVLFSSPPVSHHWEAQRYKSSSEAENDQHVDAEYSTLQEASPDLAAYKPPLGDFLSRWQEPQAAEDDFDSELSMSHAEENCEISFLGHRNGTRTMSLTLSITTPLRASRSLSRSLMRPTSAVAGKRFLQSLSPMSEFTIHQDDMKHLKSRQLQNGQPLGIANGGVHSSHTVSKLVEKLTDAEPDEPYWDCMRSLDMSNRTLENIHALDEFCPSIEELDLAGNTLQQLSGAPAALRNLNVQSNQLTSLTTWSHLVNLQYLDISGNEIESLKGFSSLIHLRELKADNNKISSLKGIEDLDGLLSLSLRDNDFEEVDFYGTELKRLANINLSSNKLHDVRGLNALPSLGELDISNNQLSLFDGEVSTSQRSQSLQCLNISNNELTGLGVDTFPSLKKLLADSNRLVELDGMRAHPSLRILSLRNQRLDAPNVLDAQHTARLDGETRLRRRVFELLLGARCPGLARVNGLPFEKEAVMAKDEVWEQLVALGVVQKA